MISNRHYIKKFIVIVLCVFWLILYFIITNNLENIDYVYLDLEFYINLCNWLGVFLFVFIIFSWKEKIGSFFNPFSIFFLFFFLFNFGQPLMWAFGIHLPTEIGGINDSYTRNDILKGQLFILFSMFSFHIGSSLVSRKKKLRTIIPNQEELNNSIFIIGIILGSFSIPLTFIRVYQFFIVAIQYGYNALYYSDHVTQGGPLMIVEMFFMPSLICLLIGSKYNKKIMYFVYLIFSIYLILNLLSGDRGSWIYKILVLIWLHSIYVKAINFKGFLKYAIIAFLGLNIVNTVISIRDEGIKGLNLNELWNASFGTESPFVSTIFEMGGSMNILLRLITDDGVREAWNYGNTYLTAFFGIISTRFLSVLGLELKLVDDWFSHEYLGISWGAGFSLIGEAFLNGGYLYAPIILIILGMILGRILYINQNIPVNKQHLNYVFVSTSLSTFIGFVRGTIYLYLKTWFYGTVVVCLLILVHYYYVKKKGKLIL